jgi:hypothetical protein
VTKAATSPWATISLRATNTNFAAKNSSPAETPGPRLQTEAKRPEDGFLDKLVNAMQGTMWVDQEEYELSKVDVHLSRKLSFFGLLGGIEKLDLQMVQNASILKPGSRKPLRSSSPAENSSPQSVSAASKTAPTSRKSLLPGNLSRVCLESWKPYRNARTCYRDPESFCRFGLSVIQSHKALQL